ncbi:MAG: hypothetical protein P9M08_07695 [Candidatus Erginobacter occultus]|nr:hypothetical protein [Candidatus Erginobacter occultus]
MNLPAPPYLKTARLKFFEHDPGLIRLRRAGRIILCGAVSLLPALIVSLLAGVDPPSGPGAVPAPDLTLVFPALIISVLLSANISGSSTRDRKLGMLRNFLGGLLVSIPASLVVEGSLAYGAVFVAVAFLALYLRKYGPAWKGTGPIALFVFVLVPRLEISPVLLPRFWAALGVAFLASFYVSFQVLPVRLVRSLLDCLARYIAAASSTVALILARLRGRAAGGEIRKARREMGDTLALWYEIASGVLPAKDPSWALLDGIAAGQFRLANLLRIADSSLSRLAAGAGEETIHRARVVAGELESVLETARRGLVLEGKIELDLDRFRRELAGFQEEWEAGTEPITALDIQIGKFAAAMERIAVVLESIAGKARRLAGREE